MSGLIPNRGQSAFPSDRRDAAARSFGREIWRTRNRSNVDYQMDESLPFPGSGPLGLINTRAINLLQYFERHRTAVAHAVR